MNNRSIADIFKKTANLSEVHELNQYKIKGLNVAAYKIEQLDTSLADLDSTQISQLDGIGKSISEKIKEILEFGITQELNDLIAQTPPGILDIMTIPGCGPKKVAVIWKQGHIEDVNALLEACQDGSLSALKGFGDKTVISIKQAIEFRMENHGKLHYAKAEILANSLIEALSNQFSDIKISTTGQLRRQMEVIDNLDFLISGFEIDEIEGFMQSMPGVELTKQKSSPFILRGVFSEFFTPFTLRFCEVQAYTNTLIRLTGSQAHLNSILSSGQTIAQVLRGKIFDSEEAFYKNIGLHTPPPEMREGINELRPIEKTGFNLVEYADLKGILHNHSTYSDGKNTLREMAEYCKELGYEYLGISDHSKTAFYAGGLTEDQIFAQHEEIDTINKDLSPFKVLKGIESDILSDGSLDYSQEVLASFDFIVASIHSGYNMSEEQATARLIKAIENPFTTILGHPTARLLLEREGYPVNHHKIIDACAANDVILEINASPYRLDVDWRHIPYALEKGVLLSINPDAHDMKGYHNMRYGWITGRKGGLTKDSTFNALGLNDMLAHLSKKQSAITTHL